MEFEFYNHQSKRLADRYNSLTFEELFEEFICYLPSPKCNILDVGAGSGRDSAWFEQKGYSVTAVEPSSNLLQEARSNYSSADINWIQDSLPYLKKIKDSNQLFDIIWLSAVWMHVPLLERDETFKNLQCLLKNEGLLFISLRIGSDEDDRNLYPVSSSEILFLSKKYEMDEILVSDSTDLFERTGVIWKKYLFKKLSSSNY